MSKSRNETNIQERQTDDLLRDEEIDEMLSPLRTTHPDDLSLAHWQSTIHQHHQMKMNNAKNFTKKYLLAKRCAEWLVAACIGFVIATAITGRDNSNSAEIASKKLSPNSEYNFDVDATELRLLAKSQ